MHNPGVLGAAAILAVIAGVIWWKEITAQRPAAHPKLLAWLFVAVGALGAGLVEAWAGLLTWQVEGVPITLIGSVAAWTLFYAEVLRGEGWHVYRTPLVSLAAGLCLALFPSTIRSLLDDPTPAKVGIAIGVVAAVLLWKGLHVTGMNWALLIGGAFAARIAAPWTGVLARYLIAGIPIIMLVIVAAWLVFYFEVIRQRGTHLIRTPVVCAVTGASLILFPGTLSLLAHHVGNGVKPVTTQVVSNITGSR